MWYSYIAVSKSQFLRLRRNCTFREDYLREAGHLKTRFLDKGYNPVELDRTIQEIEQRDRTALLAPSMVRQTDHSSKFSPKFSFFTSYSTQHFIINNILKKHWSVLRNDRTLGLALPEIPAGFPLWDCRLPLNTVNPPKKCSFFHQLKAFFPCRRWVVCRTNCLKDRNYTSFWSNTTSKSYDIQPFLTCSSKNVVYIITCSRGLHYVGRTIRAFQVRMKEHIAKIKKGYPKHSLSRQFDTHHGRDLKGTLFMAIDQYTPHWRGSHIRREISKLQISRLNVSKSYRLHGLNINWDINAFINSWVCFKVFCTFLFSFCLFLLYHYFIFLIKCLFTECFIFTVRFF